MHIHFFQFNLKPAVTNKGYNQSGLRSSISLSKSSNKFCAGLWDFLNYYIQNNHFLLMNFPAFQNANISSKRIRDDLSKKKFTLVKCL